MASIADSVVFSSHGVVPVVVQDYDTGEVVLLAHMDAEALERTAETGVAHFHNRKAPSNRPHGEDSGRLQFVKAIHLSRESEAILIRATLARPEGLERSAASFSRRWRPETASWVEEGERGFVPPAPRSD